MSTTEHAQTDFSAGELDPSLHGRFESQIYRRGVALARNWMIGQRGNLIRRNGTDLICELIDSTAYRLIKFRTSTGEKFAIGFGDQKIRIYNEAGEIYAGAGGGGAEAGPNLVVNGDFSNGDTGWTQILDAGHGYAYVSSGVAYVGAQLIRPVPSEPYETYLGAYSQTFAVATPGSHRFVFQKLNSAPLDVSVAIGGTILLTAGFTTPGAYSYDFDLVAGNVTVTFTGTSSTLASFDGVQFFHAGVAPATAAPWTRGQVEAIQYVMETAVDTLWLVHPNVAPYTLTRDGNGNWTLAAAVFMNAPAEWAGTNWPSAIELYQGRLFLGGTPAQQNTVWGSKSGTLTDFGLGTGQASDAIKFQAQTKGAVRWLAGKQALIMGTDLGEYSVTAAGGVLTPSDLQVRQESAHGTAAVQALQLGDQLVYVSNDRRKLRVMSYDFQTNNWWSKDLAFVASHLTAGRIKEIDVARDPVPSLVVTLRSGETAICTYDRAEQVLAWWRFVTAGAVQSAVLLDDDLGSSAWISAQRQNGTYLEKFTLEGDGPVQVDAAVTKVVPAGDAPVITGLDHLNGQSVQVVLDGVRLDDQVVANGQIALDRAGAAVTVGLPIDAAVQLLPPEGGSPAGTIQRAKRRWVKVFLRLNDSALPLVDGKRIADRDPTQPMDAPQPLVTGDFGPYAQAGFESRGQLTIVADQPFRCEVLAVFGSLQIGGL